MIKKELICSELFRYGSLFVDKKNNIKVPDFITNSWNRIFTPNDTILYVHPEEDFLDITLGGWKIYVVGEVFSTCSELSVDEILFDLVKTGKWNKVDYLSGRFNIYVFGEKNFIFSDPIGSKTIYYSESEQVISNHSTLVAMVIGCDVSKEILNYKQSYEYNFKGTKFLPGDITMFDKIYGLSPNNFFNFDTKKTQRFYHYNNIQNTSLNQLKLSVFEYFKNLSNFIKLKGYTPVLGLTAGVDTRLVISALKFFEVDLELVTWSRGVSVEENALIGEISKYLDKPHFYIDTTQKIGDSEFIKLSHISNYNTGFSRGNCSLTVQFKEKFSDNRKKYIFIRGLGGEIMRGMFNFSQSSQKHLTKLEYAERIYNSHKLSKIELSDTYSLFTKQAIQNFFIRGNIDILDEHVDLGDVIYWEQRMGRWASELHNENDATMKNFSGINSRLIYNLSFGLNSDIRFSRDLLIDLIKVFDDRLAGFKYI